MDITGNNCDEEPEEGCVCPSGLLRQGDDCVLPKDCGCDVILNEEGDTWHILVRIQYTVVSAHENVLKSLYFTSPD